MLYGQCQLVPGQVGKQCPLKGAPFHWSCIDCAENEPSCNQRCFAVPDVECWTVPREVCQLLCCHYQELNELWYLTVSVNLHENVKYRSAPRSSGTSARTRIWRFARSRILSVRVRVFKADQWPVQNNELQDICSQNNCTYQRYHKYDHYFLATTRMFWTSDAKVSQWRSVTM